MATAFFYVVTALVLSSVWPSVSAGTRPNDVTALQEMLRAWQGASASHAVELKWSLSEDADPCGSGWKGVGCCSQSHSVVTLSLNDVNLSGDIPSAIGGLDELVILMLSGCNLSGKVPQEIYNLKKLEYLDLSNNPHLLLDGDAQRLISLKGLPTSHVHRRLLQDNSNRINLPLFFTWIALGAIGFIAVCIFTFCFCRWRSVRKTRSDVYLMTPTPGLTTFQSKPFQSPRMVHVANQRDVDADDRQH